MYSFYDSMKVLVIAMSKPFSATELEEVSNRLRRAARNAFSRYGIKKTTVDELAREAGIAKGSFYRFFPSKEELYFDLLEDDEAELRRELAVIAERKSLPPRQMLRRILQRGLSEVQENPILRIMLQPGELHALLLRLPPERLKRHADRDSGFAARLLQPWMKHGRLNGYTLETVSGALRALFLLAAQPELLDGNEPDAVLNLYIDALADRLLPEEQKETRGGGK